MSQREAVDRAVEHLRRSGVLGDGDAAEIAAVEALADGVDSHPVFDPDLWREYRLALRALRLARPNDRDDDEIDRLIEAFRGSAEVGDSAN